MSEFAYLASISLVLGHHPACLRHEVLSAARQARSRVISEDAYRELAQKAVAAQSDNATSLSSIQSGLSEVNTRLAAVEKILKAVE